MSVPYWVASTADTFWEAAEMDEPFPRDLRRPVARALPLSVVSLPRLRVSGMNAWLERNGAACVQVTDRPLRACLVAHYGHGLAFIDGTDGDDEQRFSLAHETAHFLADYLEPREAVRRKVGERALEVLDGTRPPDEAERVHALLANVHIGAFVHLLARDGQGQASSAVSGKERDADRLALELLAPVTAVQALAGPLTAERRAAVADRLTDPFGLPPRQAERYAALLCPAEAESFVRRLKLVR